MIAIEKSQRSTKSRLHVPYWQNIATNEKKSQRTSEVATSSSIWTKHRNEQNNRNEQKNRNHQLDIEKKNFATNLIVATLNSILTWHRNEQKIATTSSILKIIATNPAVATPYSIATQYRDEKNRNHQLDIENYRNQPRSRNSVFYSDTISQWTKKSQPPARYWKLSQPIQQSQFRIL